MRGDLRGARLVVGDAEEGEFGAVVFRDELRDDVMHGEVPFCDLWIVI